MSTQPITELPIERLPVKRLMNGKAKGLNEIEVEILELCAEGMTVEEIASEMRITQHAVKMRKYRLQGKLKARCLAHAVALGFRGQFVR